MPKIIELEGMVFGRLTVLVKSITRGGKTRWLCRCECGDHVVVRGTRLSTGKTKSCGCLAREVARDGAPARNKARITHGMSDTPEHGAWKNMLGRCNNPKHAWYSHYGGRGITVCEEWHEFECFYRDVGPRPSSLHSIDRIDNDGNYEPGNVRWATDDVQNNNKRWSGRQSH